MAITVVPVSGSGTVSGTGVKSLTHTQEQIKGFAKVISEHFRKVHGDKPFNLSEIKELANNTTIPKELREAVQFFAGNSKLLELLDKAATGAKDLKTTAGALKSSTLEQVLSSVQSPSTGTSKAEVERNQLSTAFSILYRHFHGAHGYREFNLELELKNLANNPQKPKELADAAKLIIADKEIMTKLSEIADATGKKDRMTADIFNQPEKLLPKPSKEDFVAGTL